LKGGEILVLVSGLVVRGINIDVIVVFIIIIIIF